MNTNVSVCEVAAGFFREHPNQNIEIAYAENKVAMAYQKVTGDVCRDPGRAIRQLYDLEFLERVKRGVYLYNPATSSHKVIRENECNIAQTSISKNAMFDKQTLVDCLQKATASNDENAKQCFQKSLDVFNKYGIETY
jgi:hypothetical protein